MLFLELVNNFLKLIKYNDPVTYLYTIFIDEFYLIKVKNFIRYI